MPGYSRLPIGQVADEGKNALAQGVKRCLLFGIPQKKDEAGISLSLKMELSKRQIDDLKKTYGRKLVVSAMSVLCEYMSHGHCGLVKDGEVLNDPNP